MPKNAAQQWVSSNSQFKIGKREKPPKRSSGGRPDALVETAAFIWPTPWYLISSTRYCVPLPCAFIGRLSAGQIAVPPGGSPRYLPAATPSEFFGRLFSPKKVKIAAKKGNVMVKNDQMVTVLH
jgi:hypothetical protein